MHGKIVMITGANSGIGKQTAKVLAEKGATIIMICRNRERGENALKDLKEKTNSDKIELILADLTDPTAIQNAVTQFKGKYDKLDVLINNAGLVLSKKTITSLGYEKTFAVNHLGHFLLTNFLLDILIKSAPSRIINVSSEVHSSAHLNFEDINLSSKYRGFRAYANSKLANLLFTYELARRLKGTGVTVNALHPGFVRSNFGRRGRKLYERILFDIARIFAISVKRGAKTSIYLASSPEVKNITGKYFVKLKLANSSKKSYDKKAQRKLWQVSEKAFKNRILLLPRIAQDNII
jgi:NAD(P)-dependent dehydrogenase (short-subunit alcohol dehydrogenase family)